jgi:hypothetical protein
MAKEKASDRHSTLHRHRASGHRRVDQPGYQPHPNFGHSRGHARITREFNELRREVNTKIDLLTGKVYELMSK